MVSDCLGFASDWNIDGVYWRITTGIKQEPCMIPIGIFDIETQHTGKYVPYVRGLIRKVLVRVVLVQSNDIIFEHYQFTKNDLYRRRNKSVPNVRRNNAFTHVTVDFSKTNHMQHISVRFIIKVRLEYFWNVNVFMELWVINIFVVRWKWIFIY